MLDLVVGLSFDVKQILERQPLRRPTYSGCHDGAA